jgi:hypothetical protein
MRRVTECRLKRSRPWTPGWPGPKRFFRTNESTPCPLRDVRDQSHELTTITLGIVAEGLESLLNTLCRRTGRWILIAEDDRNRSHYWQALAFEDATLTTEVVPNANLNGEDRWTVDQKARLTDLGWQPPDGTGGPNWTSIEAATIPDTRAVALRAIGPLNQVFGLADPGGRLLANVLAIETAKRFSITSILSPARLDLLMRVASSRYLRRVIAIC